MAESKEKLKSLLMKMKLKSLAHSFTAGKERTVSMAQKSVLLSIILKKKSPHQRFSLSSLMNLSFS